MMKSGDKIVIAGIVIRIDDKRVDIQTGDGQLIQTNAANVAIATEKKDGTNVEKGNSIIAGSRSKRTATGTRARSST